MKRTVASDRAMRRLGCQLGRALRGGEVLELIGDVGAGKTTLTKGLAEALGIAEPVQSPTFTISRLYHASSGLTLAHYDFYRLGDAGIMSQDIAEMIQTPDSVVVIEWADAVQGMLPADRLVVRITAISETARQVELTAGGRRAAALLAGLGNEETEG